MDLRPLQAADIEQIHRLEADCYLPELHESDEAFLRLIDLFPQGALGAFDADRLCGYAFGVPLRSGDLLELRRPLARVPAGADVFYVHDVAVAAPHRGRGVGAQLARALLEVGVAQGFDAFELVSVQGSAPFWARFGFRELSRIDYAAGAVSVRMRAAGGKGATMAAFGPFADAALGEDDMAQNKCAHPACSCVVPEKGDFGKYCSDHCKKAGNITELRCGCGHSNCQ